MGSGVAPVNLDRLVEYYSGCLAAENLGRGTFTFGPDALIVSPDGDPPVEPMGLPATRDAEAFLRTHRRGASADRLNIAWPVVINRREATPVFVLEADVDLDALTVRCDAGSAALSPAGLGELGLAAPEIDSVMAAFETYPANEPDELWRFLVEQVVGRRDMPRGLERCAVLFAGSDTSAITYFLLRDLAALRSTSGSQRSKALDALLSPSEEPTDITWDASVAAPLPTNLAQEMAVHHALTRPVTVVTGPPGTGKSQMLVNAALAAVVRGDRVLIASKNNHAIKVVSDRLRALDPSVTAPKVGNKSSRADVATQMLRVLDRPAKEVTRDTTLEDVVQERLRAVLGSLDERQRVLDARLQLEWELAEIRSALPQSLRAWRRDDDTQYLQPAVAAARDALDQRDAAAAATGLAGWWRRRRMSSLQSRLDEALRVALVLLGTLARVEARGLGDRGPGAFVSALEALVLLDARRADLEELDLHEQLLPDDDQLREMLAALSDDRQVASSRRIAQVLQDGLRPMSASAHAGRQYAQRLARVANDGVGVGALRELFPAALTAFPLWVCTAMSAGSQLPLEPDLFDLVIVDEAGQCDIPSALPLIARARRVMVVGDPMQLPHIATIAERTSTRLAEAAGLTNAQLARWDYRAASLYDLADSDPTTHRILLRDHYRSTPEIIEISNRLFYGEQLHLRRAPSDGIEPVAWVDVSGTFERGPGGRSAVNKAEAQEAVSQAVALAELGLSVGIVTPYRAQVQLILRLLGDRHEGVSVDTAHGLQGDERDAIVFSTVVAGPDQWWGHAGNPNLVNVSITRAREVLRIVGDREAALASDSVLAEVAANL
jgi:hypothetical protein